MMQPARSPYTQMHSVTYASMPDSLLKRGGYRVDDSGAFATVKSSDTDIRQVTKKVRPSNVARDDLTGNKEVLILAYTNRNDVYRKYTPRMLRATFDRGVARSIQMTNEGCDLHTLRFRYKLLPCVKTLSSHLHSAIEFLAKSGIVHNDITTKNVTYNRTDDRFRLIDFGSAKLFDRKSRVFGIHPKNESKRSG
ncbi:L-type lectin-domain containing receptor kinase V.7-like [Anneissia japonica]|uniref:L-type lectin-domain containing receptor kinase V.7-like n=1 Tax=Anneissia japonica TaxID=1529436 RepID=UPI001425AFD4|nr:L-type lectin-domain containing receptor kinase V.7-like [Anneissia japonica]